MMKRLFALIPVLLFCLTMLPTTALAATVENITYLDENGTQQTAASATQVTNSDTQWTDGWYVAQSNITIDGTVTISGNVHLILEDGCNLTVNGGILLQSDSNMYIYAQSTEKERMGSLTATGTDAGFKEAGYGTQTLTIAGGKISASGSDVGISAVNLTITDGYVSALGTDLYGDSIAVYNATISGGFVDLYGDFTGTLSTGIDGHAVISSTGEIKNIAADCKGFFLIQKTGKIYGDTFTLTQDLNIANSNIVVTVEEGQTLTLDDGVTLTIPVIATLTNNGTLNNNGTIINTGTLNNSGTLNNNGTLNNTNVLNNAGSIVNNGTLTGEVNGSGTVTPKITTDSPLPEGTVGKSYTATLEATGNNITWSLVSGSALPAGLTLSSDGKITGTPTTAGESKFTVTATNASGSASKAFTITVNYQPTTITTQPQNAAVTVGQPAAFTVAATGSNLAYQWQQSTDGGKTWTDITGATGENYTTAATTMNMNGCQYRCVVKGDGGEVVSNAATLTVNPVPVTGVTLDKNTLALFTGESATLTATVAPENATDKTVTWTSDNEKVATVADGKVTAVASGTANITVTTTNGSFTATCAVTVSDKTYTISVGPGNLDFGTAYLGYAQPAAQTVTVTSTGNQRVTVALPTATNFIITAGEGFADGSAVIEPGKTAAFTVQPKQGLTVGRYAETLTVTSAEGGKVELPVTFTVNPVPVTGVTLDKKTLSLFTGDSATLTATVAPENATDKTVTWVSSNPAIVTVDGSGHVKAVAAGTANITVTTTDGNKTAVCAVTVTGRTYTLSSDPSAIAFGNVYTGYNPPAAQVVVVKNTGNQSLNLTQPKATNFGVGKLSQTALKPGETATFIVQPKAGLGAGSYKETLTISGDGGAKATVNLSFVVQASPAATATPAPTPAPTPLEMHTLHFDTNGGLPMDDVKFGLGAPVELWPYTPVRAGYLFQGWYSDQALTKAVGTIVLVKDTTIYAKWAPDPAAAASSGSSGSGSGSGSSGSGNKGGTTITVTPAPTATATPTPTPTVTPTPEPTATPEATLPPEETDKGSFPVVPVAAGAIILLVLVGGIVIFRRFRD
ncbi:Ig-like domain-containing protein [Subdoligranulum variabile]|uniref:Ig-like domain-containing protein n=1 Tax=Subdoligranulum variabile TaxID=214851 RepID=UPI0029431347|nr:Ig-like domain-containing protein [Subdoligranulum variabile]